MPKQGFAGHRAPLSADVATLVNWKTCRDGVTLDSRRRYLPGVRGIAPHARCQSAVVALNLIVIAQLMVPSFRVKLLEDSCAPGSFLLHGGYRARDDGMYCRVAWPVSSWPQGPRSCPSLRFVRYKLGCGIALVIWWLAQCWVSQRTPAGILCQSI